MVREGGLRARKKAQTRERIAEAAAGLFAKRGYDAVTMVDVAATADVSDQTVYNYFAAKQDLVLDRAAQYRALYREAVTHRGAASPAVALLPSVEADVERYRTTDLDLARGEFIALSVDSDVLRRFTLEERERQARVIAEALTETAPKLLPIVAGAYASAIVAAIQAIYDEIGRCVLDRTPQDASADRIHGELDGAFAGLDAMFASLH